MFASDFFLYETRCDHTRSNRNTHASLLTVYPLPTHPAPLASVASADSSDLSRATVAFGRPRRHRHRQWQGRFNRLPCMCSWCVRVCGSINLRISSERFGGKTTLNLLATSENASGKSKIFFSFVGRKLLASVLRAGPSRTQWSRARSARGLTASNPRADHFVTDFASIAQLSRRRA